jgi:hypothetical protein
MTDHIVPSADLVEAEDYSVDELKAVIFGESQILPRPVAVTLLARKDYKGKLKDLQRLLDDENQESRVRHSAALAMGRVGTRKAIAALHKAEKVKDRYVLRGVRQALEGLAEGLARPTKKEAQPPTWGERLEAFRKGSEELELPFPDSRRLLRLDPKRVKAIETPELEAEPGEAVEHLSRVMPGLSLSTERAMAVRCAGRDVMVLFEQTYTTAGKAGDLLSRKAAVGLVAVRYDVETRTWSPRYHVLTQPSRKKGEIQVLLTTRRGEVVYAGTARLKGERAEFTLLAVDRPGAEPTEIEGVFEDGALQSLSVRGVPGAAKKIIPSERKR